MVWLLKSRWVHLNKEYVTSNIYYTEWSEITELCISFHLVFSCPFCVAFSQLGWYHRGNTWQTGWSHINWKTQSLPSPLSSSGWVCKYRACCVFSKDLRKLTFFLFVPKDGLLSAGYTDFINRIHNQIPQVTSDGKRLQVLTELQHTRTIFDRVIGVCWYHFS